MRNLQLQSPRFIQYCGPFINDFPIKTSIRRGCSIAMFDETRGYPSCLMGAIYFQVQHLSSLLQQLKLLSPPLPVPPVPPVPPVLPVTVAAEGLATQRPFVLREAMSCLSGQKILEFMPRLMMACGREVVTYEVQRTGKGMGWGWV